VPVVSFFDPDGLIAAQGLGVAVDGDVSHMVEALRALLDDGDALALAADRARRFALDHYSPAAVVQRYVRSGATPGPESAPAVPAAAAS
jgi:hypothetical protein